MAFKILRSENRKRIGELITRRGSVRTPVFMPIATKGAVKNLTPEELKTLGADLILGNTYHLWLRPGTEIIKKAGDLHEFMNWSGPILTDSGGFQVFSLARHRKINEEGVEFQDPQGGAKHLLTPEKSIQIQLDLGSDIIMVLDECTDYPCDHEYAKKSAELTTRWAWRCKKYFDKKVIRLSEGERPLLFGIAQGSIYEDLRKKSAQDLLTLKFDGYAIGSIANGNEPRRYILNVMKWVLPMLPPDKPRYLMGLGRPEELVDFVGRGIDMFDCVIPTREARHGRIYKFKTRSDLSKKNFYETLTIDNAKFVKDFKPIDQNCSCVTCQNYSRAYLNHLFRTGEPLAQRLATIHNLKFYLELMERLRQ